MAVEDITYQVEGSRGVSTLLYPWGASRTWQLPSWQFPLFLHTRSRCRTFRSCNANIPRIWHRCPAVPFVLFESPAAI
jgi:hypothetical protein